ncbi:MAG TPA: malto-oligosyltrehalose trehalohydrolase [Polyangiaceae bacterium]
MSDAAECAVRLYDENDRPIAEHALERRDDGLFVRDLEGVGSGALYRFVLGDRALPDPYARFLPRGVHGPAMVVESDYEWRHPSVSRSLAEHVIYELHVGTFTPEGTYAGAAERLERLTELGVTAVELMPIAAFDGTRGWGYDGVAHYAPFAPYGTPDALRAFVDRAHGLGLSVLLDVVYNHFGPAGNYLSAYDARYFTRDVASPWGDAPNYAFEPMRRYAIENALYWLEEFRFDGLRLDATHAVIDHSARHVLAELAEEVAALRPKRLLVAEDERNEPSLVTRAGLDALWADDFHHAARVTLTGERDGYYGAYEPGAATVARTIRRGWLYEGQRNPVSGNARGANADELSAERFVYCIQNHDQVGNRALGDRLHDAVSSEAYLSVSLLLLFLPMTPLVFMGQEWAASSPFLYFTDHEAELGRAITEGRRREFAAFGAFSESACEVPDPQALATFERSRLDWNERTMPEHARVLEFYRSALLLRREDAVLAEPSRERLRCTALGDVLAVERWRNDERRLLLVNFGAHDVSVSELVTQLDFDGARSLLASAPHVGFDFFAAKAAVVLAKP